MHRIFCFLEKIYEKLIFRDVLCKNEDIYYLFVSFLGKSILPPPLGENLRESGSPLPNLKLPLQSCPSETQIYGTLVFIYQRTSYPKSHDGGSLWSM